MTAEMTFSNQVADAQRAMEKAFGSLNGGALSLLQAFAQSQKERAAKLALGEKALAKEVGDADPQVIGLRTEKERSVEFASALETVLKRVQALTPPEPGQQAFAGRVQTADGGLGPRMTVRLVSTVNNVRKKIGKTRTNRFGDFMLNVPLSQLSVSADATPDWHLLVEDAAGQTLASESVSVDPAQGVVVLVSLTLNPAVPTTPEPAAKTEDTKIALTRKDADAGEKHPKKPKRAGRSNRKKIQDGKETSGH
jgi:hypothetical protein